MTKRAKKAYMSDETFAELMESFMQALAYERGEREGYRITRAVVPKKSMLRGEIISTRNTLKPRRKHKNVSSKK